jgi:hypothetical protein
VLAHSIIIIVYAERAASYLLVWHIGTGLRIHVSLLSKPCLHSNKPDTDCVAHMQTLWVDPYNSLKTHQNDIIFDRGMSFEAACTKLEHEKGADDSSGFRRSRRPIFGKTMFLLELQKVGTPGVFSICRPNTGTSFFDMEV